MAITVAANLLPKNDTAVGKRAVNGLTSVVTVMRHGIFVLKIWGDRANPDR
jgi:hypothetical protein